MLIVRGEKKVICILYSVHRGRKGKIYINLGETSGEKVGKVRYQGTRRKYEMGKIWGK